MPRRRIHRHDSPGGYETAPRVEVSNKVKLSSNKGVDDGSDDEPFPSLLESSCSSVSKHSSNVNDSKFDEQDERRSSPGMVPSSSDLTGHNESQEELRTSPSMFDKEAFERDRDRSSGAVDAGGESPAMDDISMSPIPFEREEEEANDKERINPTTLMALPENILTLPISPFGPHDEAAATSS